MAAMKLMLGTERDDSMAMVDYTIVSGSVGYYFHKNEENLTPLVINSNGAIEWIENVLHVEPTADRFSHFTYHVNDEQLAMFILRWS